jgi:hypothetical protein
MFDLICIVAFSERLGCNNVRYMMVGKMIIGNVVWRYVGKMRFVDENDKWIEFNDKFVFSVILENIKRHDEWVSKYLRVI